MQIISGIMKNLQNTAEIVLIVFGKDFTSCFSFPFTIVHFLGLNFCSLYKIFKS